MIIVKLMGGLGNQMFQYACGRALAHQHNTTLKLDLSYLKRVWLERLKGNPIRHYSLDVLNIQAEIAKPGEIPPLSWFPSTRLGETIFKVSKLIAPKAPLILREIPFDLTSNLARLDHAPNHVYLDGHWQSEEYFKDISKIIRQDFTLKNKLGKESQKVAKRINQTNSVSLHIRRADYITNPRTHQFHGTCSAEFYQKCVKFVKEQVSQPHFFIFGDDLSWAKQNLKIDDAATFVKANYNTKHYYEDMYLMSLCQHNIIANSSFSRWGAWLNQNPKKMVFAPKPWFKAKVNEAGMFPKGWIRVSV